jgi:two-component system, sensor histidine kinase and response regulator
MPPLKLSGPLRILVVEDNPFNQRLVTAFLEEAGHTPVLAANGREALTALEGQSFDLVLMDVEMPDMDGFQATAAIRAREEATGSRLPILAMTAHASPEDRDRCLAAGMDAYIAKPMRYGELIELVESSVSYEREPCPAAPPVEAAFGRAGVREELASQFVDDAERLHAEMRDAIARRDGPALQRAAHSLCGTAGFFKAQTVFDLARRLESLGRAEDFSTETDRALQELADELARLAR